MLPATSGSASASGLKTRTVGSPPACTECVIELRAARERPLEKLSQPMFIAGHGQSRGALTSGRISRNRRQESRRRAVLSPETEACARRGRTCRCRGGCAGEDGPEATERTVCPARRAATGTERSGGELAATGAPRPNDQGCDGFRRGAGELESDYPSDGLPPAHSRRSHSLSRTRVRSFADDAFMTR